MITALIPVYGSNRMLGKHVGEALRGCSWVGLPFAGGLCEVPHIEARTIVCNDLNRAAMNLALVCSIDAQNLTTALYKISFHPDSLLRAQNSCRDYEKNQGGTPLEYSDGLIDWAIQYFICAWMARNGKAGTKDEFDAGLSVRWDAGGGDSVVRFRNATEALHDWHVTLRRATFQCLDAFDFLAKCKDVPGHGIYADPDWPDDGDQYKHKIGDHGKLASVLAAYKQARVVIRFGDHPLIRELYPESVWEWRKFEGRTSANKSKSEVLIVSKSVGGLF